MEHENGEPPWPFKRRLTLFERILPWHKPQVRVAAVIGTNDRPLNQWSNWSQLMPSLTALTQRLDRKATIRPWIYSRKGGNRALPFGLMHFTEENNRRWIDALASPEVYLDQLQIWSPARSSTIEKGMCPDLYIQFVGDDLLDEQGFVLSLSLDQLHALAAAADEVIRQVEALLAPGRALVADRSWEERRIAGLIRVNNLDDRGPTDAFEWAEANPNRQVQAFASKAREGMVLTPLSTQS